MWMRGCVSLIVKGEVIGVRVPRQSGRLLVRMYFEAEKVALKVLSTLRHSQEVLRSTP